VSSIEQRVLAIVAEQLRVPSDEVTAESHLLDDLNADSLDVVDLTIAIEEEFSSDDEPIEISEADADPALVEQLREWRGKVAHEKRLPAYTVLHNRTIVAVAAAKPGDRDQLLRIPGIGPTTVKRYGAALLRIVAAAGRAKPK